MKRLVGSPTLSVAVALVDAVVARPAPAQSDQLNLSSNAEVNPQH
jgi:hypothetical protein